MIPWELLDTAMAPDGGELRLMRRGGEFAITAPGGGELMNSRLGGSEAALATLALDRLGARRAPALLIGGLGMGFTLRAALERLGPEARVTVAELVPAVVRWARGPLAGVFAGCLDDPRVSVREDDVADALAPGAWDAVLLDVDNGPDALVAAGNAGLYAPAGLRRAQGALRPGGVLAIWSAAPDAGFARRLREAGFRVEEARVRARKGGGSRHVVWLALRE